jgi:hypothetical protein
MPRHSIDWFAYSVPFDLGIENAFPRHGGLFLTERRLSNRKGYDTCFALSHGSASYHSLYPQQKIGVQFMGRDLAHLRAMGLDIAELIAYALSNNGEITRLDFAIDYFGPASPRDLYLAWEAKELRTLARQCLFMLSSDRTKEEQGEAYTTYLGSNSSERMLRCYDKAAQLNVSGPWTRAELVARKGYGNRVAKAMLQEGVGAAGKQAIRDFVQCNIDWFNEATTGPSVDIDPAPPSQSDTGAWLAGFVLPILLKEIDEALAVGDMTLWKTYMDALQAKQPYPRLN